MRIGLDYDNTITVDPRFFSRAARLLGKRNKIYVISSYERKTAMSFAEAYKYKTAKLRQWKIPYEKLELAPEPIPMNKVRLCDRYGIDIMIDDDRKNVSAINRYCKGTVCLQFLPETRLK
ncbi:MAG: hypothetical protein KGH72_05900 [Candidatus Micrarchaeota archaeon]|nr:hypothetical protein [Candidatus Micrarchaeota archaeon]